MRMLNNTDKEYPCVNCGSADANIVREGVGVESPKLKCNRCGLVYSGADSLAAKEAGAIPNGAPIPSNPEPPVQRDSISPPTEVRETASTQTNAGHVPRSPAYVLVSKDRTRTEFATKKTLRQAILSWEYQKITYDVFQLTPKKVEAKLDIQ